MSYSYFLIVLFPAFIDKYTYHLLMKILRGYIYIMQKYIALSFHAIYNEPVESFNYLRRNKERHFMENYIYTLKAKAVIDITKDPQTFQDYYDHGRSTALPTEFKIDLTNPYHELNLVESFENAGDCAFFDQFRKVIYEQQKRNLISNNQYSLNDDKYLLKDKVVILNFENLFFQVDFEDSLKHNMRDDSVPDEVVEETEIIDGVEINEQTIKPSGLEQLETYVPTFSQLVRDLITFSKISIAFTKDEKNNPVFHNFVAFDKSQSMARNSRILLVAVDFLSPLFSDKQEIYSLDLSEKTNLDTDALNLELDKMQTCEGAYADPDIFFYDGRLDMIPIDYYLPEILKYRNNEEKTKDIICVSLPNKISDYSKIYPEFFSKPRNVIVSVAPYDNDDKEYKTFYPLIESENEESTHLYYIDESTWFSISGKDHKEKTETLRKEYAEYQKLYIDKRLNLGIDFYGIDLALSKFYAYRGLYLSTSKRISGFKELNQDTVIIVPDRPYGFNPENMKDYDFGEQGLDFDKDFYYQKEVLCCTNTNEIIKGRINAEPDTANNRLKNDTMFDGEGIICPEYADFIGKQLGKEDVNSFQIRMPFMKGVLHKVDFHGFLKDKTILSGYDGKYEITDCFGKTRDLKKARIIMTESMFKAAGWLKELWAEDSTFYPKTEYDDPLKFYFERFHEYGYSLYISGSDDSYRHGSLTALNYQILNTLAIEKNELKQLADMHWAHILSPLDSLLNTVDYKNADEENYSFDSVTDALKLVVLNEDIENNEDTETEEGYNSFSDEDNTLDDEINKTNAEIAEDDENAVDIESELDYESAMEKDILTKSNYYSGAAWMKLLKKDENFRYHPFIRAKLNARKVRLKRDLAQGKLLLPGEVRYLSRDLLLLLKYLLDLVYLHNIEAENTAANEKLKDGIQFIHGYLLKEECFYAPARQNPLKAEPEGIPYKNGSYYPLFRNPHLSRNEQVALKCLCDSTVTIREKYLGHLSGVIMVSGESFAPKTLGGADFDGDLVKIFDHPVVLKAVQRGICKDNIPLPIININDKPDKDTKNKQPENEKSIELPTRYRNEIDYRVLYNTFANSIGQISNKAIIDGQKHFTPDFDLTVSDCALYTILTGLEIDACKTGLHPYLPPVAYTGFYEERKKDDSSPEEEKKHTYLLPEIGKKLPAKEESTKETTHKVVYEVKYKNFIPGGKYTISCEWINKKSGKTLLSVSDSFSPEKMNDTFLLEFEVSHSEFIQFFKYPAFPFNFLFFESCESNINAVVDFHSSYAALNKYGNEKGMSVPPEDFSYIDHLIKPLENLNKGYPTLPSKKSITCNSDKSLIWNNREKGKDIEINLNNSSSKDYKSLSYLAYLFLYGHKNDTLPGLESTSDKSLKNGTFSSTFQIPENNESILNECIKKYITIKNLSKKNKKQYYRSIYYVLNRQQINNPDIRHIAEELRKLLPTKEHAIKRLPEAELDTAYEIYLEIQESDWPYLYGNEIEEEFRRLFRMNEEPIPAAVSCILDFRAKGYHLLNLFLSYVMCMIKDDLKEDNTQTDLAAFFAKKCKAELKKELKCDPFPYLYTISNDKSSNLYKNYGNGKLDLIWLCYSADEILEKIKEYTGYVNIDLLK